MAQVPTKRSNQGGALGTPREHPLVRLQHDFDSLFQTLWGGRFTPFFRDVEPTRMWDFDLIETEREVIVRAEMPGFEANELDVQLNNDTLTIRAEKEQKGEQEEYRSFSRTMTIPADIDADKVQASYRNGVLELRMPRKEGAQPRRIKVQEHQAGSGAVQTHAGNPAETAQPDKK